MKKITALCILLLLGTVSTIHAETEQNQTITKKHQVGLRLGTWGNSGTILPLSIPFSPTDSLITSIQNVNLYVEGFYSYNIFSSFFTEVSFGMVNRGNIQYYNAGIYDYSNLLLYPLLAQIKFYPFNSPVNKFQPFFGVGGGFYFAKQDLQFTNVSYYAQYNGASETDINYTLSGGFDWQLRSNLSLEFQTKYMPINFSDYFIGAKNYTATTITIGFKYKYNSLKK